MGSKLAMWGEDRALVDSDGDMVLGWTFEVQTK